MTILEYILAEWYGEREIVGERSNPRILKLQQEYAPWIDNDGEIAWCAMFMSHCCKVINYKLPSPILAARQFLSIGVEIKKPVMGDLVIYWRGSPGGWKGHVGVFIREQDNIIWTLGGNQTDAVTMSAYHCSRVLGYRRVRT